jgi:UDP-glucose 4-epimerase
MILVTGASGLIGRYLCTRLEREGVPVRRFDLRNGPAQDVRDRDGLAAALQGVTGVVHLAAISRVLWAEQDPALCTATNVEALEALVGLCLECRPRPWLIFASSREVYGNPARLPVHEDDPLLPINVYGRSKRDGERLVQAGLHAGLVANICRFSNVYGCPHDHADRVVMAFAAAAAHGGVISLEGGDSTFDFTCVEDVVEGLWRLIQASAAGERLPPVHFVSGIGTTLRELASMAVARARGPIRIDETPTDDFRVSGFVGDPARARALLGWTAQGDLGQELSRLIGTLASARSASPSAQQV